MSNAIAPPDYSAVMSRILNRPDPYCPWSDLRRRHGIDLRWHSADDNMGFDFAPQAVTAFDQLAISISVGLSQVVMRLSLAHELVHLDRGPVTSDRTDAEENKVDRMAVQRLVDPVIYDALSLGGRQIPPHERVRLLQASAECLRIYEGWRAGVSFKTALSRYEQYGPHRWPEWPAPWIATKSQEWPMAARFAQAAPRHVARSLSASGRTIDA
ncbi:hypothetical protein [Aeromicrobium sp.]|uniref:hypothetical protein n=1 Tax=Aeromicrobium sp. TaxID=1871063 RepID=UPI002FC5940B